MKMTYEDNKPKEGEWWFWVLSDARMGAGIEKVQVVTYTSVDTVIVQRTYYSWDDFKKVDVEHRRFHEVLLGELKAPVPAAFQ